MVAIDTLQFHTPSNSNYDRLSELKAFDETKAGVKGLVDSSITQVPRIFVHPPHSSPLSKTTQFTFPIIDLDCTDEGLIRHKEIVDRIRDASETWGFFQVVNYGILVKVLEEMLEGGKRFHEQDTELKKHWYTRDSTKRVVYHTNFDLFRSSAANWRDSLYCTMDPNPPNPEELPLACSLSTTRTNLSH
ncbi:hypothetical protein LguiA_001218 [Lonicera macranthoides]